MRTVAKDFPFTGVTVSATLPPKLFNYDLVQRPHLMLEPWPPNLDDKSGSNNTTSVSSIIYLE